MKKLFLLFYLSLTLSCNPVLAQWMSTINITPATQIEKVEGQWEYKAPVVLSYGLMYSFSSGFYAGGAIGGGGDVNEGNINLNTPALLFVGFQPSEKLFSFFLGYGENLSSGNEVLAFGIHFTGFATGASNEKYKSIVSNDDYARNRIGFIKEEK